MYFSKKLLNFIIIFSVIIQLTLFNITNASANTVNALVSETDGILYGDVNLDKNIDIVDVTLLQKHLAEIELLSETQLINANVDDKDNIDIKDATLIQKYIVQLIDYFPIQISSEPVLTSEIADGNYFLKLKNSNLYLNHQGGISNGTNVSVTQLNDDANMTQNVKITSNEINVYALLSPIDENMVIGAYRNGTYATPLGQGKNINLWENTDIDAQKWQFVKTYDGYYIIKLKSLENTAIAVSQSSEGANIYLGEYNPNDNLQQWELVPTTEYKKTENTAIINQDLNVRSGPNVSYPSIGIFKQNQQVTVIGSIYGDWCEVRGINSKDETEIIGFCNKNYMKFLFEPKMQARVLGNVNARTGAGIDYDSIGVFDKGIQVTVIGDAIGNWYKVRGARSSDGKIITAYSSKSYISINEIILDYDNKKPNLYSESYNKTISPFANSNLYGQCTWYAWGRAKEVTGINVPCRGNAKTWYSTASSAGFTVSDQPRKNSIVVWSSDNYGHVAYVEKVNGDKVTITESNWYRTTLDSQYTTESGFYYYSGYTTLTISQMSSRYGTLLGYIYL